MFLFQRNDVYLRNQWSNYTNWLYDYLPNDIALASEIGTYCSNFAEGRNRDNTHSFLYATGNYSDENTKIALTSGIEYQISSKLSLFAETDVYSIFDAICRFYNCLCRNVR